MERVTGYTASECYAMGNYPLPLVAAADREMIAELIGRPAGQEPGDLEFRIVRKDGSIRWVSVAWQPIYGEAGRFLGHRAGARDVHRPGAGGANAREREGPAHSSTWT